MTVWQSYKQTWARRSFTIPVMVAVGLLSVAVIAPIIGLALRLWVRSSGQSAVTDQDIASLIFSPLGFPLFLLVAGLVLVGTVFGFAVLTLDLCTPDTGLRPALTSAIRLMLRKLPVLCRYTALLVLRILAIVAPFALVGLLLFQTQLSDYDINYYLSEKPPEFLRTVGIGIVLAAGLAAVLLPRLLGWALSLHYVLFGQARARDAFALSQSDMFGKRLALFRTLLAWFAIRMVLVVALGLIFTLALRTLPGLMGGALSLKLGMAVLLVSAWGIGGFVINAIATGALARLLLRAYHGPQALPELPASAPASLTRPAILAAITASLLATSLLTATQLMHTDTTPRDVQVIAHRGAAGARPENTLASVDKALEDKADWVEIDVQETADGQVVVIHDSDLMKQANTDLKIWDATMDDLTQIDIGSWFDPAYADARVPTLEQVLAMVDGKAKLLIELKYYGHDENLESRTIDLVEKAGMADQVAVMSLKYPAVEKMRSLRPDWPAGVLAATALGDLSRLDGDFVAINATMVGPRLIKRVQAADKQLFVWTLNDPLQMAAMLSLGIDGMITDEPKLARETIDWHASLAPHERLFLVFLQRFGLLEHAADARP